MTDFAAARRMMVDGQVRTADVTDLRLLAAMLELPRERFFPEDKASLAYLDLDVPVSAPGQPVRRLLKPMVLAKLIQAAGIAGTDRVLDVGCATGYSTALLAHLAGSVVGARGGCRRWRGRRPTRCRAAGLANAKIVTGPLGARMRGRGALRRDPAEGSAEVVPPALFDQLKEGGRLVWRARARPAARRCFTAGSRAISAAGRCSTLRQPPLPGFAKPPEFVF